jgi:hypothetical protein
MQSILTQTVLQFIYPSSFLQENSTWIREHLFSLGAKQQNVSIPILDTKACSAERVKLELDKNSITDYDS